MQHTPGPWVTRYSDDAPSGKPLFSVDSQSTIVCAGAMESDAHLIAAAPALLEALRGLMQAERDRNEKPGFVSAGNFVRAKVAARAAIAAATGLE